MVGGLVVVVMLLGLLPFKAFLLLLLLLLLLVLLLGRVLGRGL